MPLSDKAKRQKEYAKQHVEYAKKTYKRVPLDLKKDKYNEVKKASKAVGESVNGYIKKAIDDRLNGSK